MAKPILTITIPISQKEKSNGLAADIENTLNYEYHVLVCFSENKKEIGFNVFYEKDHIPIDIQGLKELIKKQHNGKAAV